MARPIHYTYATCASYRVEYDANHAGYSQAVAAAKAEGRSWIGPAETRALGRTAPAPQVRQDPRKVTCEVCLGNLASLAVHLRNTLRKQQEG